MSAFRQRQYYVDGVVTDDHRYLVMHPEAWIALIGFRYGELTFYHLGHTVACTVPNWDRPDGPQPIPQSFGFDAFIPKIAIANFIGEHPERLVDGFTAAEKPAGCGWMAQSVIKSIVNHMGSVLVELEPAQAA